MIEQIFVKAGSTHCRRALRGPTQTEIGRQSGLLRNNHQPISAGRAASYRKPPHAAGAPRAALGRPVQETTSQPLRSFCRFAIGAATAPAMSQATTNHQPPTTNQQPPTNNHFGDPWGQVLYRACRVKPCKLSGAGSAPIRPAPAQGRQGQPFAGTGS